MREPPPRLSIDRYMAPAASIRSFYRTLHEGCPLHWHEFYEMHLITRGEARHVLNGVAYPLTAGSFFLMTPADFHEIWPTPDAPLTLYNVIFSDDALSEEVRQLVLQDPLPNGRDEHVVQLEGEMFAAITREFHRIWVEENAARLGYRHMMQGALERILIDTFRHRLDVAPPRPAVLPDSARQIRTAIVYLHHHFREPLTLAHVASRANLSPNYFSELFHRVTGSPFQTYLHELRLRFARSLLSVSDLPVTEIAYASGFSSLSHFERSFRRSVGLSPRSYRHAHAAVLA